MKRATLAVGAIPLWIAAVAVIPSSASATPQNCSQNYQLLVGGQGSQQRMNQTGYRYMSVFADPGAKVEYIDNGTDFWPLETDSFDLSRQEGYDQLKGRIDTIHREDPDACVEVVAHSQGADVASRVDEDLLKEEYPGDKIRFVLLSPPNSPVGIERYPGFYPGASSRGAVQRDELLPDTTRVWNEHDAVGNLPTPWSDPAGFVQSIVGFANGVQPFPVSQHGEYLNWQTDLPAGDHQIDTPPPVKELPEHSLTGLPNDIPDFPPPLRIDYSLPSNENPTLPVTDWAAPSFPDVEQAVADFAVTPISDYVPDEIEQYVPQEVLAWTPPPVPSLPPAPVLPTPQQVQQGAHDALAGIGITIPGL